MTRPERPVFIGFHLTKKENQDRKSGPNRFGSVRFCGFNRSLGPDFQALERCNRTMMTKKEQRKKIVTVPKRRCMTSLGRFPAVSSSFVASKYSSVESA